MMSFPAAPPLGGPGKVVEIDETYLAGRRKNNVGRMLEGNEAPPARTNYGNQVNGPWVFGMIERKEVDG